MTTLHEVGPQPQLVELRVPIDVSDLARALAAEVVTHFSQDARGPEGYVNSQKALTWLGWGSKGYDRLLTLCQEEEIPHYRPPGSRLLYFKLSELDEWLKGQS